MAQQEKDLSVECLIIHKQNAFNYLCYNEFETKQFQ